MLLIPGLFIGDRDVIRRNAYNVSKLLVNLCLVNSEACAEHARDEGQP